jgi:hypothetical protein
MSIATVMLRQDRLGDDEYVISMQVLEMSEDTRGEGFIGRAETSRRYNIEVRSILEPELSLSNFSEGEAFSWNTIYLRGNTEERDNHTVTDTTNDPNLFDELVRCLRSCNIEVLDTTPKKKPVVVDPFWGV